MQNAVGQAGTNWDFLANADVLNVQSTSTNLFVNQLRSVDLNPDDTNAGAANFDNSAPHNWIIATANGGIANFNPARFSVDTTGFANPLGGGFFSVQTNGNSLVLTFTNGQSPTIRTIGANGSNLTFSGDGGAGGGGYFVLTTTINLTLPLELWIVLMTNPFDAGGNFTFTNSYNSTSPQQFYLLQLS